MPRTPWYPSRVHPGAHAALALALAGAPAGLAAEPVAYRFTGGDAFTFQVVQETRPAQGPSHTRAELDYRFEVGEVAGGRAKLTVAIAGRGVRGPDAASASPEGVKGRSLEYAGIEAGLTVGATGPDGPARSAGAPEAGSPEWAIAANAGQFFPVLASDGATVRGKVFGPDLFRDFPDDRPELTGLMWTEEAVETRFAAPVAVRVGDLELVRVDFTGGFEKTTTHRGVDFAGTYAIVGFALLDPALGRPVAFKIDDTRSGYTIRVTGGSFIPRKVAEKRLAAANRGRTPIGLEACDPGYLARVKEYAGFTRLGAGGAVPGPITPQAALDAPAGGGTSLLGM